MRPASAHEQQHGILPQESWILVQSFHNISLRLLETQNSRNELNCSTAFAQIGILECFSRIIRFHPDEKAADIICVKSALKVPSPGEATYSRPNLIASILSLVNHLSNESTRISFAFNPTSIPSPTFREYCDGDTCIKCSEHPPLVDHRKWWNFASLAMTMLVTDADGFRWEQASLSTCDRRGSEIYYT